VPLTTVPYPHTQAIVLKRIPFGDSSLVVHLFCEDRGRAAILVKGAFRAKGAYFGAFDLLDRLDVALVPRRAGALGAPSSVLTLDNHRRLRTRLDALAAAVYAAELLDFALTESPQGTLYRTFADWLAWLDSPAPTTAEAIAISTLTFELRFLAELGLEPQLESCASCGTALGTVSGERLYSVGAGGVLCAKCAEREPAPRPFHAEALQLAIALRNGETPAASAAASRELRRFLDEFHRYYLDTMPRSRPAVGRLWRADARNPLSCS
jgi:DNA repair protein RecO (recombination protein O)